MAAFKVAIDARERDDEARKRDEGRAEERTERERADEIAKVQRFLGSTDRNEQSAAASLLERAARKRYFWSEIDGAFIKELAKNKDTEFAKELWGVAMKLESEVVQRILERVGNDPDLPTKELAVKLAEQNPQSNDAVRRMASSLRQGFPKSKDPNERPPQQLVVEADVMLTLVYWDQKVDIDTESKTALGKVDADDVPYVRIPYAEYKAQSRQLTFGTIVVVRDRKNHKISYAQYAGSAGAERTDRYAISQKVAGDLGRPKNERGSRWQLGEIAFQFFPNTPSSKPLPAEEIAVKGRQLQSQAWPPVLLRYSDDSQRESANQLQNKLLQPDPIKQLPAFNLPNPPDKINIPFSGPAEIRYFRDPDVGAAWDVLERLRLIDASLFGSINPKYVTGYDKPPQRIEVVLGR